MISGLTVGVRSMLQNDAINAEIESIEGRPGQRTGLDAPDQLDRRKTAWLILGLGAVTAAALSTAAFLNAVGESPYPPHSDVDRDDPSHDEGGGTCGSTEP